jgi:thioredoxin-like negative regulator of GroEL
MHRRNNFITTVVVMIAMTMAAQLACVKGPAITEVDAGLPEKRILTLTLANFDSAIASNYDLAMIDFYSPGCRSCISLAPIFDSLACTLPSTVLMGKVDVTVEMALTNTYGIGLLPTVVFIRHGAEALRVAGVYTVEYYTGIVDSLLQLP